MLPLVCASSCGCPECQLRLHTCAGANSWLFLVGWLGLLCLIRPHSPTPAPVAVSCPAGNATTLYGLLSGQRADLEWWMKDDGSQFLFQVWPLMPAASLLPLPAVAAAAASSAAAPAALLLALLPHCLQYGWWRGGSAAARGCLALLTLPPRASPCGVLQGPWDDTVAGVTDVIQVRPCSSSISSTGRPP